MGLNRCVANDLQLLSAYVRNDSPLSPGTDNVPMRVVKRIPPSSSIGTMNVHGVTSSGLHGKHSGDGQHGASVSVNISTDMNLLENTVGQSSNGSVEYSRQSVNTRQLLTT